MIPYHVLREDTHAHVVTWNGAKDGPGGRYLAASEEIARPVPTGDDAVKVERRTALAAEIVRCLRVTGPMTRGELRKMLNAGADGIDSRLHALVTRGLVVVVGARESTRVGWGRGTTLYALHDPRRDRSPLDNAKDEA